MPDKISFNLDQSLFTGETIYLQADNDMFLARTPGVYIRPVNAGRDAICAFKVTVVSPTKIALQADDNKYLSRMGVFIQAAKSERDKYCEFTVVALATPDSHGLTIALQADDESNMYLSRIFNQGDQDQYIEAQKAGIDQFCHFRVSRIV